MPNKVAKRNGKFRVIEGDTGRIVKNKSGTAIDGGGFSSKDKAQKQASAVNISQAKRKNS